MYKERDGRWRKYKELFWYWSDYAGPSSSWLLPLSDCDWCSGEMKLAWWTPKVMRCATIASHSPKRLRTRNDFVITGILGFATDDEQRAARWDFSVPAMHIEFVELNQVLWIRQYWFDLSNEQRNDSSHWDLCWWREQWKWIMRWMAKMDHQSARFFEVVSSGEMPVSQFTMSIGVTISNWSGNDRR